MLDYLQLSSVLVALLSLALTVLAQRAAVSEKTARYADFINRIERLISGKSLSTRPLEIELDEAVGQLTKASTRVGEILSEVQTDVDKRRSEASKLRSLVEELRKEYETNKSLANLTAEQAGAVRQLLSKEVSSLKRRSYLPDILINFSVGAIFFVLGIAVTVYLGK